MSATARATRRLLVVDDDPSVREAVEMILRLDGHLVETVNSGSEALSVFMPGKFDLVFTDYYMPAMTGDKLAAALRGRSPSQPIVMLTAYGEKLQASGSPLTCVDAFIGKPFEIESLRKAVAKFSPASNP
jgi:two-component system, response regulator FlrC